MVKTYCLKERKLTENISPKVIKTVNGRLIEISIYSSCGVKKLYLLIYDTF